VAALAAAAGAVREVERRDGTISRVEHHRGACSLVNDNAPGEVSRQRDDIALVAIFTELGDAHDMRCEILPVGDVDLGVIPEEVNRGLTSCRVAAAAVAPKLVANGAEEAVTVPICGPEEQPLPKSFCASSLSRAGRMGLTTAAAGAYWTVFVERAGPGGAGLLGPGSGLLVAPAGGAGLRWPGPAGESPPTGACAEARAGSSPLHVFGTGADADASGPALSRLAGGLMVSPRESSEVGAWRRRL